MTGNVISGLLQRYIIICTCSVSCPVLGIHCSCDFSCTSPPVSSDLLHIFPTQLRDFRLIGTKLYLCSVSQSPQDSMANLDVPRPRSSYIRDISPSGQSEVSDSSIDDSPDTTLAYAKEKRTSRGLSNILLPACLRPRRKRMTEKAFDQWQAKERRPLVNLLVLLILAAVLIV